MDRIGFQPNLHNIKEMLAGLIIILVVAVVIVTVLLTFVWRAYGRPLAQAQNALEVVNYVDASRIAVRDGIKHEQALTNAEALTKLNTQQLRDMRRFIEMNRVALAATETRGELAKSVMDAV